MFQVVRKSDGKQVSVYDVLNTELKDGNKVYFLIYNEDTNNWSYESSVRYKPVFYSYELGTRTFDLMKRQERMRGI